MKHCYIFKYVLALLAVALALPSWSQWPSHKSVLAEHTWYKIGVIADGVYGIDYATMQAWGVDVQQLDPSKIKMYGNVQGVLPERNSADRYDDLTEIAIQVKGSEDGSFDEGDGILFYGQGPVNTSWIASSHYDYERNPYSDTVYYFLCIDAEEEGLRVEDRESIPLNDTPKILTEYPDCYYHESEELSPYASGRTWFGDLFTGKEGYKDFEMNFPGILGSYDMNVEASLMARSKTRAYYSLLVNEETVAGHQLIDTYGDYEYGKMYSVTRKIRPTSEDVVLRFELEPGSGNPMFFIDYFILSFWRTLQYREGGIAFRLVPTQLNAENTMVKIADADTTLTCWNVTDPLRPFHQLMEMQDEMAIFGLNNQGELRYQLFGADDVKAVSSCRSISNQNLHGLETADMLIVTPSLFWNQAQALASFHEEHDNMNCVLVDVDEIYNEFSTGKVDPTAVRDLIRMVYLRSDGQLKYVLLLGKGTHDYRNIKGVGNNFVPIYENDVSPCSEVSSMCSDDYFALMGDNEGNNCEGLVDLGVGRIPITTPEQGDDVMAKILHYVDLKSSHGIWKNNHLLLADNDTKQYAKSAEELGDIIEIENPTATVCKLYMDSYPVVSTPSGNRIPMAHQALMDYFDRGIQTMSYTGHGGVKSLSSEWVLALSDILSLSNYDKLPFIHTATCEFSKLDKPDVVSGGELLLLNSHGGAIALLTTMRPTQAQNNQQLSRSLSRHLYEKIDGESLRFGDVYRIVKSDPAYYKKANIVYVLLGDPALRMSYPTRQIQTELVSGSEILEIKGCILDQDSILDSLFNGILDVRLYDQKSQYTTMGNYDIPVEYACYNDVLFEGKASVKDGRFQLEIPMPASVSQGDGDTRLSYYAYDSIRNVDANGVYCGSFIEIPDGIVDNQGPDIHLYWNTPEFESGDTVPPFGTLYADLYDEHGIYHYNVSIGRDIVMRSNISEYDNKVMNDSYEPVLDDSRRGRITLPFEELENGAYEFMLKAWDTWNNPTEAEIVVIVERNTILAQIKSFPNPFENEVYFSFVNGEMTGELDVLLEVFDVMGRRVATVQEHTCSTAGKVPLIHWDGKADGGYDLRQGIYAYRLNITDSKGKTRVVSHRMIKK